MSSVAGVRIGTPPSIIPASDWSRSLVRLDEASALALGHDADLDHAAAVGSDALSITAHKPIASIAGRASELAAQLQRRDPHRRGREFAEALQVWKLGGAPA